MAKITQADLVAEQIEKTAETLAAGLMTRVRSVIDALVPPDGPAVEIVLEHEGHIATAALAASKARADLQQANTKLEQAEVVTANLNGRLTQLEATRNAILARRMGGIINHDDALQIGLINADVEGLRQLATRALPHWSHSSPPIWRIWKPGPKVANPDICGSLSGSRPTTLRAL